MSYQLGRKVSKTAWVWNLSLAVLIAGYVIATGTEAAAQKIAAPTAPAAITPPAGNSAFLAGHAKGTQGYVCLPTKTGASWTVNGSRPEASLASLAGDGGQIITHFLSPATTPNEFAPSPLPFGSPTWQSSLDSSVVWAKALTPSVVAGSNASCAHAGSIPCLLLQSIGAQKGPTGGQLMTQTTYVQRLNTNGGSAPAAGCATAADVGKQTLVPYTADYYFFRSDK